MKSNYLSELQSRRKFIRHTACAAVGTLAMSNVLRDMRFINSALAQSSISDYKALICVFLNGGNDANNMIIPTIPSEWTSYAAARTSILAIPNTDGGPATALALNSKNGQVGYPANDNHTYGLHPAMPELQGLFNTGKAAVLFNVGTLSYPMTKAQYQSGSVPKPPQLYSHSDQQTQWQTSIPDQPAVSGWGGRICDLMTTPVDVNAGGQISMAVTLAGSNLFEVGNVNAAPQYSVSTGGAVNLSGSISGARLTAMQSLLAADKNSPDLQTNAYAHVLDHAINEASIVTTALANNSSAAFLSRFPTNVITPNGGATFSSSLMSQMKMVARLIDVGKNFLGMKRQIFFIQVGGYDTHTVQTASAATGVVSNANVVIGAQAQLLAELSQTLNALYLALGDIGTLRGDAQMQNRVTAFTVSDFARTFPSNGSGSDHGWGGHHFVMGGAVKGQATYGKLPTLTVNGPDDTGTGRWIPTTSVDQYAATLASWFGVDQGNISTIFPNIGRFASSNLGFI